MPSPKRRKLLKPKIEIRTDKDGYEYVALDPLTAHFYFPSSILEPPGMNQTLLNRRVAILAADGFEQAALEQPMKALG